MKIAVFAHACLLEVNRAIYHRLADDGYKVFIIVPSNYSVSAQPAHGPVEVRACHRSGKGQRFHWYSNTSSSLDTFDPDFVLLDLEPDSLLAVQLARWCSRNQRKLIIQTCENLSLADTVRGKPFIARLGQYLLRKLFLTYTIPRTFHALPISSMGRDLLISFGLDHNRITRIPLGVDTRKFMPSTADRFTLRARWDAPQGVPVVAYVGRMVRQKGVHLLLEALIRLADLSWKFAIDDFKVDNSDPDREGSYGLEIQQLLSHPAFDQRVIRIHAAHHEIPAVMNAIDILVAPSIRIDGFLEQYGRVIPEALACGTMVIASDTGAFPEVGGDVTHYFKEGNVDDLTRVLREAILLSDNERQAEATARRAFASKNLSLDAQHEIVLRLLCS